MAIDTIQKNTRKFWDTILSPRSEDYLLPWLVLFIALKTIWKICRFDTGEFRPDFQLVSIEKWNQIGKNSIRKVLLTFLRSSMHPIHWLDCQHDYIWIKHLHKSYVQY